MFSRTLGGNLYCIYYLGRTKQWLVPVKYLLQGLRTFQVLLAERPAAIHVQSPPFICSLVINLYCQLFNARYVIDHHSASFSQVWDWALPIQKRLARNAITNIVTNRYWADIIQNWDANALIMGDPFLDLPAGSKYQVSDKFNIVFVNTFSPDEPLVQVLEAVNELDDVHLYITGNSAYIDPHLLKQLTPNITLTGFLPDEDYVGLLRSVDAVMVLTTRDHTLQLGGCESVAVGQPLITSDWPYLKEFFNMGTVHVGNNPSSIRDGILSLMRDHNKLQNEIKELKINGRKEWESQISELNMHAESWQ